MCSAGALLFIEYQTICNVERIILYQYTKHHWEIWNEYGFSATEQRYVT